MDGSYYVLNISPGKYDIEVSMVGYKKTIQKNTIINSGKTTVANIALDFLQSSGWDCNSSGNAP